MEESPTPGTQAVIVRPRSRTASERQFPTTLIRTDAWSLPLCRAEFVSASIVMRYAAVSTAPDAVRVARMAVRDGVPEVPDDPDQRRYLDAQQIYRDACRPLERAAIVIDNAAPDRPRIARISAGLAHRAHNDQS